jgi:hypothetical protein
MMKQLLLLFSLIICVVASRAQNAAESDLTPKYNNEFLTIGVGARALGMSQSQVASVGDVTAGYWNPAGLMNMRESIQVAAMHSEYFAGIAKYDYVGIGKSLDSVSAVSLSLIRFGVDDIPNTTQLIDAGGNIDYSRITQFSAVDYAFVLSYGHKGLPFLKKSNLSLFNPETNRIQGFRWGASAKVIYRHIGDFAQAWGFGFDAGIQYDVKRWHFGAAARDITNTFNAWTFNLDDATKQVFEQTGNDIPPNGLDLTLPRIILGAARDFQIKKISILAEFNANITTDGKRNTLISSNPISIDPSIGAEVGYNNVIYLRLGAGNVTKATDFDGSNYYTIQPNLGVGLRIKQLTIDYALSNIGNVSEIQYSNIFSLKYDFVKK